MAGVGAVILAALLVRHFSREPSYKGRPLSAWAADLRSGESAVRQSALEALKEWEGFGVRQWHDARVHHG